MTALSYMTYLDWAQHGTAMDRQSALIREWLGTPPYVFAVADTSKLRGKPADMQTIDFLSPTPSHSTIVNITDLARQNTSGAASSGRVVVMHPDDERELDATRRLAENGEYERIFVMIWTGQDHIRPWLDGQNAINLGTGEVPHPLDPALTEAGRWIVDVEYNGLSSGRGKDTVVHLVRDFAADGVPTDPALWLRTYFAAGGSFRHAPSLEKLVREIRDGVRHRVTQRFQGNLVQHIRNRLEDPTE
jgi:hypothetical protein